MPALQRSYLEQLWADAQREVEARRACKGHSFTRVDPKSALLGFRCYHCGARFRPSEKAIYEQGLEHGKKFGNDCTCNPLEQTGGGHRRDCPEFDPRAE